MSQSGTPEEPEAVDDVEVVSGTDAASGNPLEALLGGGELPDLGSLFDGLAAAQAMQTEVYEGSAGGGLVRIRANGRMEVESVVITAGALEGSDEPDLELLADLVHAAITDLTNRIAAAQQQAMGPLGGLLGQ